ncbi:MAG: MFS transporter [Candidatus Hodarchaeales archaeon]|jgi:MFS family permease
MIVNKLLGTQELPVDAQYCMRTFLYLSMMISFLASLSSTFYVLFAIDAIGFALAAICTSVMLATQMIFDYPSGSLGDWIGQRWVLAIAFGFYGIGFFLLISATTYLDFVLISVINGLGNAQSSGTFNTWVDNNYRASVGDADPDRKIYGFSTSRVNTFNSISLGSSFMVGGLLATLYTRQFVFTIQFGLSALVIALILYFLKDIQSTKSQALKSYSSISDNIQSYFGFLKGGISFFFSSKKVFLYLIGSSIYNVTWMIWGSLILFPLYFGYTGTDVLASLLRTSLFFAGIPLSFVMANVSKRVSNNKLPVILFLETILFFPSFITLTLFIQPLDEFNLTGIVITFILLWTLVGTIFNLGTTLNQRIMVDLVPSENRNSVYSLMPTIFSLIGIFILPIAGLLVEEFGLAAGIMCAGVTCIVGSVLIYLGMRIKHVTVDTSPKGYTNSLQIAYEP